MIEVAFLLFSSLVAICFFIGSLTLMILGRRLGARHLAREGSTTMTGLNAIDGAIFALMGLVLAFAISGALQRFDERKQLILQEANAVGTAYDRLDLFDEKERLALKSLTKAYFQIRIDVYHKGLDFSLWEGAELTSAERIKRLSKLEAEIWQGAVNACAPAEKRAACVLILPSLNSMFDSARTRNGANERHPPSIVYAMLFGLGLGGSLLAGFGMAATRTQSWVHMVAFAGALAFVLFVVTDIEFPRLGLVRVDSFDHFLTDLYDQMR